jgi:hypothetical protein
MEGEELDKEFIDLDHERIMRRTAEIIGKTNADFGGVFSVAYREFRGARA